MPPSQSQATFALKQVCHSSITFVIYIAVVRHMFCVQGVLNVSLALSWVPYFSPINITGAFIVDPNSVMVISLPTNPYSGVAPIAVGSLMSIEGY